jgi:hypothetical protein
MKGLLIVLTLLVRLAGFSQTASTSVTVRLDSASTIGTHTNVSFLCHVRVRNETESALTATNLFARPPGLALRITTPDGKELKRTYAAPLHIWKFTFAPNEQQTFKLMYGVPGIGGSYQHPGIPLPGDGRTVLVQIEGTLSGSSYTNRIVSNAVEVKIP